MHAVYLESIVAIIMDGLTTQSMREKIIRKEGRVCWAMAEALTLQKELHKLCSCLDPVVLSTALFAKEIIDDRAWEEARQNGPIYDRCLKLMETVLRKTKACPAVFHDFCSLLEEETITENVGAELKSMYLFRYFNSLLIGYFLIGL